MEISRLLTASLQACPKGNNIARILSAALEAVEPATAVHRFMKVQQGVNDYDRSSTLTIGGKSYLLDEVGRVFVVGAGKAGAPMTKAAVEILETRIERGVVIVKEGYAGGLDRIGPISILEAGHPIPDERGVFGSEKIIELLLETREEDLVLCLFSGGGSALMISPSEELTLADLQGLTEILLRCGASIFEINTLRKHLERLKGGQLARLASPAPSATLILSDVVGDRLEAIASGPTVPDPTTFQDSLAILERHGIVQQVPGPVLHHLRRGDKGDLLDTPKPGDPIFQSAHHAIIGSNLQAAEAALAQANSEGFNALLLSTYLQGEARQAGRMISSIARQIALDGRPISRPACLVAGGETTVTIQGQGKGAGTRSWPWAQSPNSMGCQV